MQINNNTAAFNVWKNYTGNVNNLRKSMSKLSSGSRINNAGDDPSGLAMSERLRTQSRNTSAAASNVENRLNYLQTTDSWMQKMHDMLGRMGELAVMANDGTKSSTDKSVLQKEFKQMQDEIARITTGTNSAGKFNGLGLFDATDAGGPLVDGDALDGISLQVGADGGQVFTGTSMNLTTAAIRATDDGLGTHEGAAVTWGALINSGEAVATRIVLTDLDRNADSDLLDLNETTAKNASMAVGAVNAGIDHLSNMRADVGAEMKRMSQTLEGLRNYEENITATESRIRDVDVAKETSEMSKYSILQQVGTAMLAQANQMPQGVLQLLG